MIISDTKLKYFLVELMPPATAVEGKRCDFEAQRYVVIEDTPDMCGMVRAIKADGLTVTTSGCKRMKLCWLILRLMLPNMLPQ